jgi:hypothetical protein
MKEQIAVISHGQHSLDRVARGLGFALPILGVSTAGALAFVSRTPIPIEKPLVLVLGSLGLLVPLRGRYWAALQQAVAFYLVAVLFNMLHMGFLQLQIGSRSMNVSYSVGPLLLCVIGYCCTRASTNDATRSPGLMGPLYPWIGALVVIVAHMVLLAVLLRKFYGYGYEHDWSVLGHLSLYFLLFLIVRRQLAKRRFQCVLGLVLTILYLLHSVKG